MKRIRIFAGPNGSGKSTLTNDFLKDMPWLINTQLHIDPDNLNTKEIVDFGTFGIQTDISEFRDHLLKSTLFPKSGIDIDDVKFENNSLVNNLNNEYVGSLVADFIREKLLDADIDLFSFETVFSHKSKLEFMERAVQKGWELYLYFIGTSDSTINQGRVSERAEKGQHDVPNDKIITRYERSNSFLCDAVKLCRRAYVYDNSDAASILILEKQADGTIRFEDENRVPQWVDTYFLSKLE